MCIAREIILFYVVLFALSVKISYIVSIILAFIIFLPLIAILSCFGTTSDEKKQAENNGKE